MSTFIMKSSSASRKMEQKDLASASSRSLFPKASVLSVKSEPPLSPVLMSVFSYCASPSTPIDSHKVSSEMRKKEFQILFTYLRVIQGT